MADEMQFSCALREPGKGAVFTYSKKYIPSHHLPEDTIAFQLFSKLGLSVFFSDTFAMDLPGSNDYYRSMKEGLNSYLINKFGKLLNDPELADLSSVYVSIPSGIYAGHKRLLVWNGRSKYAIYDKISSIGFSHIHHQIVPIITELANTK